MGFLGIAGVGGGAGREPLNLKACLSNFPLVWTVLVRLLNHLKSMITLETMLELLRKETTLKADSVSHTRTRTCTRVVHS